MLVTETWNGILLRTCYYQIDYQSIITMNLYYIADLKSTTERTDIVGIQQKGNSARLVCRFLYC